MKTNVYFLFFFGLIFLFPAFGNLANASHSQGSGISYVCVAPNNYIVTLKIIRDCNGGGPPTAPNLIISSPGCNAGRTIPMTKSGGNLLGTEFCSQLGPVNCSFAPYPNFEEVTFITTLNFTASEAQCPDWILSWTECCWTNSINVLNPATSNIYTEATLRLGATGNSFNNNSAQFVSPLVRQINGGQAIKVSSLAVDPDGDSLVYSLEAPLDNNRAPFTFGAFNAPGGIIYKPQDSSQLAVVQTADRQFSPLFPIPSYQVNWAQPAPRNATKAFALNQQNGTFKFIAPAYIPNKAPYMPDNNYILAIKVEEYRKIGSGMVKVGSIRREMMLTVVNSGANANPIVASPTANGQLLPEGEIIRLRPGTPLTLTFAADDPDQADLLTLESQLNLILPGATFSKTTGNRPVGTITWIPTVSDVRSQPYYFPVRVRDNACPVKGIVDQVFAIKVSNSGGVTGITEAVQNQFAFTASPNPFRSEISFNVNKSQVQQQILIYNSLGQLIDQLEVKAGGTGQEQSWEKAGSQKSGFYIARLVQNGRPVQTIRFTKVN